MSSLQPRTQADFERAAQAVWDALPEHFRRAVGNIAVQVTDFADWRTLDDMRIGDAYDLLGLYHGIGLPFKSVGDLPRGPDIIFLYRIPILAYAGRAREPVEVIIRHVLIHEIGHHFGFSDADMQAIEDAA
jgi:predicted Zn-dependent protease with MMP-like domain